ncbi:hypothetical protein LCGC14_0885050 [marine sediment metagenome]|uniref:Type I-E CRISPR-associated protein Cse2/CasB n=1 Tax=marine sediment metagenome TaxID=412755 RepID=A0A0F9P0V8_9ZZZZ
MKEEKNQLQETFISKLKNARTGDLAILKRASGLILAESRLAMGVFYKFLPPQLQNPWNEEIYFLIATLFGFNSYPFSGSFGKSMRLVHQKTKSDSIPNRMMSLLNSSFGLVDNRYPGGGETTFRIRQCVRLASSHDVGVNWLELLNDLLYWTHEDGFIQKKWSRDFFSEYKQEVSNDLKKK